MREGWKTVTLGDIAQIKGGKRVPNPPSLCPALEQQLTASLLEFETLDEAWPKGRTAVERAQIGRELEDRITCARAETLADAAAQLRRLAAITEAEDGAGLHSVLSLPDARRLVTSVLHAVERAVEAERGEAAA